MVDSIFDYCFLEENLLFSHHIYQWSLSFSGKCGSTIYQKTFKDVKYWCFKWLIFSCNCLMLQRQLRGAFRIWVFLFSASWNKSENVSWPLQLLFVILQIIKWSFPVVILLLQLHKSSKWSFIPLYPVSSSTIQHTLQDT